MKSTFLIPAVFLIMIPASTGCSREAEHGEDFLNPGPEAAAREAIEASDLETLKTIIPQNLDVESIIGRGGNPVGDTPLALAVWEANQFSAVNQEAVRVVEYLISAGADVNRPNRDGRTPLHFPHNFEVVEMLLQAGADVDIQASVDGTTPMYRTDNIQILKLLVPVSANLNVVDANGKTALDYHMQWAHARSEIIELMHAYGAKKGRVLSGEENGEKDLPQD